MQRNGELSIMSLTIEQAEKALVSAAIKHTSWHEAAGFRFRVFQVPPTFDCNDLPPEFEVIFNIGDDCIVREQIDDYGNDCGLFISS